MQGSGKVSRSPIIFPSAARRMDTLNDLLAASDLVSLHCALTNETVQIINADCLQHIKPGISIFITCANIFSAFQTKKKRKEGCIIPCIHVNVI